MKQVTLNDLSLSATRAMNVKAGDALIHEAVHASTVKTPAPNPPPPAPTDPRVYRSGPGAAF